MQTRKRAIENAEKAEVWPPKSQQHVTMTSLGEPTTARFQLEEVPVSCGELLDKQRLAWEAVDEERQVWDAIDEQHK